VAIWELSDRCSFNQSMLDSALDMVDRAAVLDVEISSLNGPKARYFGIVPTAALELVVCDLETGGGIFNAQESTRNTRPQLPFSAT